MEKVLTNGTNGHKKRGGARAASAHPEARESAAPAGTKKKIELPEIEIETVPLRIVGISPLIVHAWSAKAKQQMRDKQQKNATQPRAAKDPNADFEGAKYKDPETGKDCVRAAFFKNAIVSACRFDDGLKMTVIRGAIFVEGDFLPLKFRKCQMREDMVRVGQGKSDLRYRPEYLDWSVDITVSYNARMLSVEQVVNLIRLAGYSVGLCEWRPERNGIYGRFTVEAAKALKVKKAALA